jgi:hypothetical protein
VGGVGTPTILANKGNAVNISIRKNTNRTNPHELTHELTHAHLPEAFPPFQRTTRSDSLGNISFGTGNRGGSMIVRPKSSGLRPFESISGNQSFRIFVIRPALFNSSLATA